MARHPGRKHLVNDTLQQAAELEARNEPFVLATVVRVDRPVSAKPGDRAVVTPEGKLSGWVGGSCSEPIVIREALAALSDGSPRLVRIRPPGAAPGPAQPGVVVEVTACESEGGVEVFVEPRLAVPQLVIIGSSPIARTIAELARTIGYRVRAAVESPSERVPAAVDQLDLRELASAALRTEDAVVVATMNRYDDDALEAGLATGAGYIGLVASRPRTERLLALLRSRGTAPEALDRVHGPAGFDLGPSSQPEIALAILAEAVSERHRVKTEVTEEFCEPDQQAPVAIDPICGMTVAIVDDAISAEHEDATYYFCGPGCRKAFTADPGAALGRATG
jgi:xanthine dehydrogenase accessory factor